eukprot:jgi/Botrbrau1/12116/Bobra.0186s0034.1
MPLCCRSLDNGVLGATTTLRGTNSDRRPIVRVAGYGVQICSWCLQAIKLFTTQCLSSDALLLFDLALFEFAAIYYLQSVEGYKPISTRSPWFRQRATAHYLGVLHMCFVLFSEDSQLRRPSSVRRRTSGSMHILHYPA